VLSAAELALTAHLSSGTARAVSPKGGKVESCTGQLASGSRDLLKKLTVTQQAKEFSAFYATQRFITMFTTARHWILPAHLF
jgi:hypothetical protein